MTESITSDLKIKGGNIHVSAVHNKKFQCALLHIDFKTDEKTLLTYLLQKYVCEKRLCVGLNMNNAITSAIVGETSIALFVPENKLTQNISLLYTYLHKSHLSTQQAKQCGSGNYKKLCNSLRNFDVTITGKCKNFIQAVKNNAPKIENLINQINSVEAKEREAFSYNTTSTERSVDLNDFDSTAQLYLAICVEDIPCRITKNKITFLSNHGYERFEEKMMWKDVLQAKVKSFLTQTGSVGTPSSNDKGGEKFKAKCKNILTCENTLCSIIGKLHGVKHSFSDVNELKKVDSEAMSKVRSLKVKCSGCDK